jgi:RND superfamily putative drug exporter
MFGNANWWLPGWLDRLIPQLNVEGADSDDAEPSATAALEPSSL